MGPIGVEQRKIGGKYAAHNDLPFAADVPEFHLEGQGGPQGADAQGNGDFDGALHRDLAAERAVQDGSVNFNGVVADGQNEQAAGQNAQGHCAQAEQQHLTAAALRPLHHMKQRLAAGGFVLVHALTSPVIIRPICSLVTVLASTTPVTLPWHSTMMRSHSCSSTSRSSPMNITATPFSFCWFSRS